jgi:hypothetical protein
MWGAHFPVWRVTEPELHPHATREGSLYSYFAEMKHGD